MSKITEKKLNKLIYDLSKKFRYTYFMYYTNTFSIITSYNSFLNLI